MHEELSLKEVKKEWHGTYKSYVIGFIASLLLTSLSFLLVITKAITGPALIFIIVSLALIQAVMQLLYFLHLGQEEETHWEAVTFYFMVVILVIVAFGSLWIMYNLNDRMMSDMPMEMTHD